MTMRHMRGRRLMVTAATVVLAAAGLQALSGAASAATPVAQLRVPAGFYDFESGGGSLWAMTNDEQTYSTLYRIDPSTNQVVERVHLGYAAAFVQYGYGSLWVSDYYASTVHRYSLDGVEQAVIHVGLQPQWLLIAFDSVWSSNHHGHSVSRIDPSTNTVIATMQIGARTFRNGPQQMVASSRYVYVGSSNLTYLQRIDPATDRVINLANTGKVCCGLLQYTPGTAGGTIWDLGSTVLYARDLLGGVRSRVLADSGDRLSGLSYDGTGLWYGENGANRTARLREIDPQTGAHLHDIPFTGRAGDVLAADGSVWVLDFSSGIVSRFDPTAAVT